VNNKKYSEKLKDPRWQKKRLAVFERDKWRCQACGEEELTLAVHHLRYVPGKEPWEYNNNDLLTLCENCHETEYHYRKQVENTLLTILARRHFTANDLDVIARAFEKIPIHEAGEVTATIIEFIFGNRDIYSMNERLFWENLNAETKKADG